MINHPLNFSPLITSGGSSSANLTNMNTSSLPGTTSSLLQKTEIALPSCSIKSRINWLKYEKLLEEIIAKNPHNKFKEENSFDKFKKGKTSYWEGIACKLTAKVQEQFAEFVRFNGTVCHNKWSALCKQKKAEGELPSNRKIDNLSNPLAANFPHRNQVKSFSTLSFVDHSKWQQLANKYLNNQVVENLATDQNASFSSEDQRLAGQPNSFSTLSFVDESKWQQLANKYLNNQVVENLATDQNASFSSEDQRLAGQPNSFSTPSFIAQPEWQQLANKYLNNHEVENLATDQNASFSSEDQRLAGQPNAFSTPSFVAQPEWQQQANEYLNNHVVENLPADRNDSFSSEDQRLAGQPNYFSTLSFVDQSKWQQLANEYLN